ncbi:MAG: ComEC/Rec2 family competence protein, partial [bacterium]
VGYLRANPIWHGENQNGERFGQMANRFRDGVRQAVDDLPLSGDARGLLRALTTGDRGGIDQQDWTRFARAGVVHLLVISGLHIGMAALFGFLLCGFAGRLFLLSRPSANA